MTTGLGLSVTTQPRSLGRDQDWRGEVDLPMPRANASSSSAERVCSARQTVRRSAVVSSYSAAEDSVAAMMDSSSDLTRTVIS